MQISSNTPTNGRADNYTSVISGTPAKTPKKLKLTVHGLLW